MRFHNTQFSAPEADRRIMLPVSFFVMALLWLLCATVLGFIGLAAFSSDTFVWDTEHRVIVAALGVLAVGIIPIQLVRYVRKMRASK